ncbi:cytochrome P450 [Henriciella sp. AS95]|uniref:cytochrome P450 n=1 Tax=Henriciella sp. AS95 TaxID=3135782 RepID=UPI00317FDE98
MSVETTQDVPAHVPDALRFEFDLYGLSGRSNLTDNVQAGVARMLEEAPDLFFTSLNGGHWVAKRFDVMSRILTDPEHFSSCQLTLPKSSGQPTLIPLTLDPPAHTPYRLILMKHFSSKRVNALEDEVRAKARELVNAAAETAQGDFMAKIAIPLPVYVFLKLMGLPETKFHRFREIVEEWFSIPNGPRRQELAAEIIGHLREAIGERRKAPQNDLISALIEEQSGPAGLGEDELESMCFLLFLAGLDTVANGAGFMFERLAARPELQQALAGSEELRKGFLEETLRTCGVVNTVRTVVSDVELEGVKLKAGDLVLCPLALAGYDESVNGCPHQFDAERQSRTHLMFSTGPHLCVGHLLARLELRVLLEECLAGFSHFELDENAPKRIKIGSIIALLSLPMTWKKRTQQA